jgi:hypothetical protein
MNKRQEAACAVAGLVGVVLILVGLIIAKYLPPPKANWSTAHFASFYAGDTHRIRLGILLMLVATCGWATLMAVVTAQLSRAPGGDTMAWLNAMAGAATYVLLVLFATILGAAAFRPTRSGAETQLLHDLGWFMAFLAAPPFVVQAGAVGIGVLSDRSEKPVYPRWLGWLGIWTALLLAPGTILLFFHSGVFAYHGLISYWIPLFAFGGWMAAMSLAAYLHATAKEPAAAT